MGGVDVNKLSPLPMGINKVIHTHKFVGQYLSTDIMTG